MRLRPQRRLRLRAKITFLVGATKELLCLQEGLLSAARKASQKAGACALALGKAYWELINVLGLL